MATRNGAFLGVVRKGQFDARTWVHNVDLFVEQRAEIERLERQADEVEKEWAPVISWY